MKGITTIKIHKETKERLSRLKEHQRETYEEVIRKILYVLNRTRKDPVSSNRLLSKIDNKIVRRAGDTKELNKDKKDQEVKVKPDSNPKQNPQQDKGSH